MNRALPCLRCRRARLGNTVAQSASHPLARRGYTSSSSSSSSSSPPASAEPGSNGSGAVASKRPSSAPKPIIDIRHIRQNPELYERTCIERNYHRQARNPSRIAELHERWQALTRGSRSTRERSNLLRKLLANPATSSDDGDLEDVRKMSRDDVQAEARRLKLDLAGMEGEEARVLAKMEELALEIPNLTHEETPRGREPVVVEKGVTPPREDQLRDDVPSHAQIGTDLGILDFAAAATSSGWGWYYLVGEGAQLEQALVSYALDRFRRDPSWLQVSPPSIVYSHIGAACGFQPRDQNGEQQVYTLAQSGSDAEREVPELCLTGTSEISLAGMKAMSVIHAEDLPMKRVAVSRCYRAEAGARGADTKGLYRVHEFTKVEMFAWTEPDEARAQAVYDEMLAMQVAIIKDLGLPARVLHMPASDLGASATRKTDMEVWFPSRAAKLGGWGEVSSLSLCTDYQTRRLSTRTRIEGGKMGFPWTVNGTALAAPRVLAAILENGWDEETGTVEVPEVLRQYMDGKDRIGLESKRKKKKVDGV